MDRETQTHRQRHTVRDTDTETCIHRDTHRYRHKHTHTETHRHKHTHTEAHRQRHTNRDIRTEKHRQRYTFRDAKTEAHIYLLLHFFPLFHQCADFVALTRLVKTSLFLVASPILVKSIMLLLHVFPDIVHPNLPLPLSASLSLLMAVYRCDW